MKDEINPLDAPRSEQAVRSAAEALIAKYGWTVLTVEELVGRALEPPQPEGAPKSLERLLLFHCALAIFEACRQTADPKLREHGYMDLSRYLYRAAFNSWPDQAEDMIQRALELVYKHIDDCTKPAAFLSFAIFKLRQARKEMWRGMGLTLPLELHDRPVMLEDDAASLTEMMREEHRMVLLEALKHLPEASRHTIVFKYFDELNDEEISSRMGITAIYVRVLRSRGIKQLREDPDLRDYFA